MYGVAIKIGFDQPGFGQFDSSVPAIKFPRHMFFFSCSLLRNNQLVFISGVSPNPYFPAAGSNLFWLVQYLFMT